MYKTMEEIEREYDGNFICMINYKKNEYYGIIGGEVIAVSKNKKEILEIWGKTPRSFYQWVGEFPDAPGGYLL
ncbi:MAG: hypothetical protein FWG44_01115 [Oscillospiraceae bacterium]|nr:hypothetical protein [Oscillospiraceae bacterium]